MYDFPQAYESATSVLWIWLCSPPLSLEISFYVVGSCESNTIPGEHHVEYGSTVAGL